MCQFLEICATCPLFCILNFTDSFVPNGPSAVVNLTLWRNEALSLELGQQETSVDLHLPMPQRGTQIHSSCLLSPSFTSTEHVPCVHRGALRGLNSSLDSTDNQLTALCLTCQLNSFQFFPFQPQLSFVSSCKISISSHYLKKLSLLAKEPPVKTNILQIQVFIFNITFLNIKKSKISGNNIFLFLSNKEEEKQCLQKTK